MFYLTLPLASKRPISYSSFYPVCWSCKQFGRDESVWKTKWGKNFICLRKLILTIGNHAVRFGNLLNVMYWMCWLPNLHCTLHNLQYSGIKYAFWLKIGVSGYTIIFFSYFYQGGGWCDLVFVFLDGKPSEWDPVIKKGICPQMSKFFPWVLVPFLFDLDRNWDGWVASPWKCTHSP